MTAVAVCPDGYEWNASGPCTPDGAGRPMPYLRERTIEAVTPASTASRTSGSAVRARTQIQPIAISTMIPTTSRSPRLTSWSAPSWPGRCQPAPGSPVERAQAETVASRSVSGPPTSTSTVTSTKTTSAATRTGIPTGSGYRRRGRRPRFPRAGAGRAGGVGRGRGCPGRAPTARPIVARAAPAPLGRRETRPGSAGEPPAAPGEPPAAPSEPPAAPRGRSVTRR